VAEIEVYKSNHGWTVPDVPNEPKPHLQHSRCRARMDEAPCTLQNFPLLNSCVNRTREKTQLSLSARPAHYITLVPVKAGSSLRALPPRRRIGGPPHARPPSAFSGSEYLTLWMLSLAARREVKYIRYPNHRPPYCGWSTWRCTK
jgi:hypothetical protein